MSGHAFRADCALARVHASPNHGPRRDGRAPDSIILHYTGMASAQGALAVLCDPAREVSCHYFIYEDGAVLQLVPEALRAWHAGASLWQGERDMNSRSIGIEIVNPGHAGGVETGAVPPFPLPQIAAVIALCRDIIARHRIAPERVLAHSDIAPGRKIDPGETFPWRALSEAGVGRWVAPAPLRSGLALEPGARGKAVADLQRRLARYGYGLDISGEYDAQTERVVRAFQRHFRPGLVDGRADPSTRATLRALLAASDPAQTRG